MTHHLAPNDLSVRMGQIWVETETAECDLGDARLYHRDAGVVCGSEGRPTAAVFGFGSPRYGKPCDGRMHHDPVPRRVLPFVDGPGFARDFLSDVGRRRLRTFVRPLCTVHVNAGLDDVRMPGPSQTTEL